MSENLPWIPVNGPEHRPFSAMEFEFLKDQVSTISTQLSIKDANLELAREELNDVVGRMNDVSAAHWVDMTSGSMDQGLQLSVLKSIAARLRDMTETNPLLKRGHQVRRDYVYARGMNVDIKPATAQARIRRYVEDPFNEELLFTEEGHDTMMRARYTDGNRFTLVNKSDKTTIHVPLEQITNAILDPMDPSRIRYIQRSFNGGMTWYATDLYDSKAKSSVTVAKGTNPVSVDRKWVMVHKAFNRPTGATWGLPDALAGYLWVLAYSNYLKDNAALVKAYSSIALKVSAATKAGAANASVAFNRDNPGVGGTASMGRGIDVEAMPTSGSNVNFNNGRPLAAMVATSLGVSIVALLSDPGTGGSYGVAETLDPPTLLLAQTLQKSEAEFYKRILRVYGANRDTEVTFPHIEQDPAYRILQAIFQAVAQGLMSREEARPLVAALLDMSDLTVDDLPEPDGFNVWRDPNPTGAAPAVGDGSADMPSDPTPRQGNSGAAGSATQGDTNNDMRTDNE